MPAAPKLEARPLDSKRLSKAIVATPLVARLPETMRRRLVDLVMDIAQSDDAKAGEVLFRIGEKNTDEGVFFLEGAVKVTRASGQVLYFEAPDVLGEVQLFSPGAERTATVETVFGGTLMRFSWKELGAAAKAAFTAEELVLLREAIRDTAAAREKNLLTSLKKQPRP